jgi:hypothetical protein
VSRSGRGGQTIAAVTEGGEAMESRIDVSADTQAAGGEPDMQEAMNKHSDGGLQTQVEISDAAMLCTAPDRPVHGIALGGQKCGHRRKERV